jgi:hypothetical protein
MYSRTDGSNAVAKADEVAQLPRSSNQSTMSALCPARPIADRALIDRVTTRPPC